MSADTDTYDPFDDDLPTVQIPLGRDRAGLTVDGTFYSLLQLPEDAAESYRQYVEGGGRPGGMGQPDVHMCDDCAERSENGVGYLTTSNNVGSYGRNKYACSNEWREEQLVVNGGTAGRFAPNPWNVLVEVNGDTSRTITDEDEGESRMYTITVRKDEEYHADTDVLGETTIKFTAKPGTEKTITGETDGDRWEADVEVFGETIRVEWRCVDENGETIQYAYVDTDGMEHQNPNRVLGLLPLDDIDFAGREGEPVRRGGKMISREYDIDDDTVVVRDLATTVESRVAERECGNTSFTRVYPAGTLVDEDDMVPVHALTADDVPNSALHLSRIQNQLSDSLSQDEFLQEVAVACKEFWERHGYPDDHPKSQV